MSVELGSALGKITVEDDVVATIAGSAALECYGLVGMASRKQLKDGIAEILKRENLSRGVVIRREDHLLHIDLHIIVSYGTKISEVAHNIQSKVKYVLNDIVGLHVDFVNVIVQDVRVTQER